MDQELSVTKRYFINENEEVLEYDVYANTSDYYNPKYFSLVGKGVVCMINGILLGFSWDNPENILYFYKKTNKFSILDF